MAERSIGRKKERDDLKTKRTKLFEQFVKQPADIGLALAIKVIDDQVAECNEWLRAENKNAQIKEKNHVRLRKSSSKIDRLQN